jgi:hypothetical protein
MRAAVAIAWREIEERWTWLGLAVVLGLAPFAATLVGIRDHDMQGAIALILFSLLAVISTLVFGSSIMAGDLAQGRLGFLLARPVSWRSLWAGKLAATVLLAGSSVLVMVPALVAIKGLQTAAVLAMDLVGTIVFVSWIVIGIAVGQSVTISLKSRSPWLLVDLAGAVTSVYFGLRVLGRLELSGALGHDATGFAIPLAAVGLAAVIATAAPFARGGVNVRRAHSALSTAAWAVIGTLLLVGWLVGGWAAHPRATDFRKVWVGETDARGRWVTLLGQGRGRSEHQPALFFAPDATSVPTLVGSGLMQPWSVAVSDDGDTAAWIEGRSDFRSAPFEGIAEDVYFARASATDPVDLHLALPLVPEGNTLALSPSGDRLAVSMPDRLQVFDLATRRVATQVEMPHVLFSRQARFVSDDAIILYGSLTRGGSLEIVRVSLSSARAEVTGHMEAAHRLVLGRQGRLLAVDFSLRRVRLHDAISGQILATLADDRTSTPPEGVFTADGRIAVLAVKGGQARLRVFTEVGNEAGAIDLGPTGGGSRLDVDSRGRLLVGFFRTDRTRETVIIDPATLQVVRHLAGLVPLRGPQDPRLRSPQETADDNDLFIDAQNRVVRFDPDGGATTVVIGPRG